MSAGLNFSCSLNPCPCHGSFYKLLGSPSFFKASHGLLSLPHAASFWHGPSCLPFGHTLGTPRLFRITSQPQSQLISILTSICHLNTSLPWNVTHSYILGIRMYTCLGVGVCVFWPTVDCEPRVVLVQILNRDKLNTLSKE